MNLSTKIAGNSWKCRFGVDTGLDGSVGGNDEPLTEKWAPSEWGPDDRLGQ